MGKESENKIQLRLYLAGDTRLSRLATANLKNIRATLKDEECQVEIINIQKQPLTAISERIIATPTLDKIAPPPRERMIGDLSDYEKVLSILTKEYAIEESYEKRTRTADKPKRK